MYILYVLLVKKNKLCYTYIYKRDTISVMTNSLMFIDNLGAGELVLIALFVLLILGVMKIFNNLFK